MLDILREFDHSLFIFFNSTIANPLFDLIMPLITNEKVWGIPMILSWLALVIYGGKHGRIAALLILFAVGFSDLLCARIIKPYVGRIRPSHVFEPIRLLVNKGGRYSFPSNHSANITAGMTVLIFYFRKYWKWFFIIACCVSFSRIYVGVHYPLDVLAGMIIGFSIAFGFIIITVVITNHFQKMRIPKKREQIG